LAELIISDWLSGIHANESTNTSVSLRSGPPSGETEYTPPARRNAIWRPSGDQAGLAADSGLVVSRKGVPPSTSLT
jgi:hypothetical protein